MYHRPMRLQRMYCLTGFHPRPPRRDPAGPVVAYCPCCGKGVYYYGNDLYSLDEYRNIALSSFPHVIGPMSAT